MRVSLLHNSDSGSKDHTADEIAQTIRSLGHEIVSVAHSLAELKAGLNGNSSELIAIAGGDGTVSRAACALSGSPIPLAILPHGTANNTALSLGVRGSLAQIIDSWRNGKLVPFDLLVATDGERSTPFAEAMGWGVFPCVIAEAKRRESSRGAARALDDERALFREVAERTQPRRYEVEVDGIDCSGEYLLVEISNVPFIGPQLSISPDSRSGDGLLEVTLWGSAEREHLRRLLGSPPEAPPTGGPKARVGKRVTVNASDAVCHLDGHLQTLESGGPRRVGCSVRPAAVHYLLGGIDRSRPLSP